MNAIKLFSLGLALAFVFGGLAQLDVFNEAEQTRLSNDGWRVNAQHADAVAHAFK